MSTALRFALAGLALFSIAAAAQGTPTWEEVSSASGIRFLHAGADGGGTFLEVTGAGVCFADFDGDGYEDLYFTNANYEDPELQRLYAPRSQLYRNLGDGTFADVTAGSGADVRGWVHGCAAADYDADGDLDLAVVAYGENTLLRNDGPFRFTNVTLEAGASSIGLCPKSYPCWGSGVSFGDADGDGCLDFYVANYVEYDVNVHNGTGPEFYSGQRNLFYHNLCDGTFREEAEAWNLDDDPGFRRSKSFQAMWADHDGDGDDDLYVVSDGTPNTLFRNNADGSFTDVALVAGVADSRASMGLEFQDFDGDGLPDLYFTHFALEHNGYYLNDGAGNFTDRSGEGALAKDLEYTGWGTFFFDYDNDGDSDIFVANGKVADGLAGYAEARLLFRNDGRGEFEEVSATAGSGLTMASIARGAAFADPDFDGDLDIAVANTGNTTANLLRASGVAGGWIEIALRQPGRNPDAIGAVVQVTPEGGVPATRIVQAGHSYESQNTLYQHFGLATAERADVEVTWPDGTRESWKAVGRNQVVRLTRDDPRPEPDVLSPVTTVLVTGPERNGWYVLRPQVGFEASDRGVTDASGVARIEYRVDGFRWREYHGPFTLFSGEHTLDYRAVDVAGNAEPVRSQRIRVDPFPPTSELEAEGLTADGWFTESSRIRLTGEDLHSGVAALEWRETDGEWTAYAGPFGIEGEGPRVIHHRAIDVAENVGEPGSATLRLDTLPPRTRLRVEGPALFRDGRTFVTSSTRILLDPQDAGSGVSGTELRWRTGPWLPYPGAFSLSGEDGEYPIAWRSHDALGHVEEAKTRVLHLDDRTPPPLRIDSPPPSQVHSAAERLDAGQRVNVAVLRGEVPVRAAALPDVQGNAFLRVLVDGEERARTSGLAIDWAWDTRREAPGPHVLRFEAADGAGNVGAREIQVVVLPLPGGP